MLPVALGTHARGSTIRPASFCGTYALKPTFGAINRQGSFSMAYSMDHLGVFAGTLSDMWTTARFIVQEAGGDPGYPGLDGALCPPPPRKPTRLIRLDTAGWPAAEPAAKAALEAYLLRLADAGVEIVTRRDDAAIEAYEAALAGMPQLWTNLYRFEMHWPMLQYRERHADKLPPRLLKGIEDGAHITQETYRAALIEREQLRAMHDELAQRADGFITLSSPGPGPIGMDQGSAIFNEASSVLGAPAINLPLLAVDAAPLGVQLLGRWHGDERLTAIARWLAEVHFGNPPDGRFAAPPRWRGPKIAVTIFESLGHTGDVHAFLVSRVSASVAGSRLIAATPPLHRTASGWPLGTPTQIPTLAPGPKPSSSSPLTPA